MYRLKITCFTPKGKAEKSSKSFGVKYFHALKKPIETKIISDREFYYIYEYTKIEEMEKVYKKKLPKAEQSIRNFYTRVIGMVERGNKIGKKGAWGIEKVRRWILRSLRKKGYKEKEIEDFVNAIDLSDKKEMLDFLGGTLFKYTIILGDDLD